MKCSVLTKPPLFWNISGCATALRHYSFCKMLHLKCLTLFWICFCLGHCAVTCIVTLRYVLHQTHSELLHIRNPVYYCSLFFCLGFLSQTFKIHRTAGEGGRYLFNSLNHFHLLHRHLDISREITAESSSLHIALIWTQTRNLWFLSASR